MLDGLVVTVLVAVNAVVLALGAVIAHLAYRAYRRTGQASMRRFTVGFGLVTLGLFAGGGLHLVAGAAVAGSLAGVTLAGLGLGVLTYSLYAADGDPTPLCEDNA